MPGLEFVLASLLVLAQAEKPGARPPIAQRLSPALKKASAKAAGKKVLVVVTKNGRNSPETWRVARAMQDGIQRYLRENGVGVLVSPKVETMLEEREQDRSQKKIPVGLNEFRKLESFDALLIGVYLHSGKNRALRLKLYAGEKKTAVWKTTLSFDERDVRIEDHTPELNKKILGFARSKKGEKVGDGECWTLAALALEKAGARRDGIYRFGRELAPRDVILPGDVIQFEKVKIGSATMPHHTAVVYEVLGPETLRIIHQNFGSAGKTVSLFTIDLRTRQSGTIQLFRPRK